MRPERVGVLATFALILAGCERVTAPGEEPPPPSSPSWSEPRYIDLDVDGLPQSADLAFAAGRMLLTFHTWAEGRGMVAIYVAERSGETWMPPRHISSVGHPPMDPYISHDPAGVRHALWGVRGSSPTGRPSAPTEVWYARGDGAGVWSEPVRVHASPMELQPPRNVIADAGGNVLAFHAEQHLDRQNGLWWIKVARPTASGWVVNEVAAGMAPFPHRWPDGRLSVAYIWADTVKPPTPGLRSSDVFIKHSSDGGMTWGQPIPVHAPDPLHMHDPVLVQGAGGLLHALWLKDLLGDIWPDAVLHSTSADGGTTWTTPVEVAGPELHLHPRNIRGVVDPSGSLHIVFTAGIIGETNRLYYARWKDGAWTPAEHMFGANNVRQRAAIGVDIDGAVHVVVSANDVGERPGLYHSILQPSSK